MPPTWSCRDYPGRENRGRPRRREPPGPKPSFRSHPARLPVRVPDLIAAIEGYPGRVQIRASPESRQSRELSRRGRKPRSYTQRAGYARHTCQRKACLPGDTWGLAHVMSRQPSVDRRLRSGARGQRWRPGITPCLEPEAVKPQERVLGFHPENPVGAFSAPPPQPSPLGCALAPVSSRNSNC